MVVGGGLAGITAALSLADAGVHVTLLEGRPRLGGLAFSFQRGELTVDNGQHVYMRCCTAYRWFLDRVDGAALAPLQNRLDVPVLDAEGTSGRRLGRLRRDTLPVPCIWGAASPRTPTSRSPSAPAWGAPHWRSRRSTSPIPRWTNGTSAAGWPSTVSRRGPSRRCGTSWGSPPSTRWPGTPPSGSPRWCSRRVCCPNRERPTSAGPMSRWENCTTGWQARRSTRRVSVPSSVPASPLSPPWRTGTGGSRCPGESIDADTVVLAVPQRETYDLLPAGALDEPGRLLEIGTAPILNVHVVYDRKVLTSPFFAALGSPVQWVFDRTGASGLREGQYLALSQSAAQDEIDTPVSELRERYLPELERLLPFTRGARVKDFFVTRERTATFAPAPGVGRLRPGARTKAPGLYLAGAWTATGWPATMESAVRSGIGAADTALAALGRSRDHLLDHGGGGVTLEAHRTGSRTLGTANTSHLERLCPLCPRP